MNRKSHSIMLKWIFVLAYLTPMNAQDTTKKEWDVKDDGYNASKVWEAIDARPIPEWYKDAKFGIFVHWGLYSVPSWSPKGTYTEWYQKWLQGKKIFGNNNPDSKAIPKFQEEVYGDESNYYDFAKMFKAELYDPVEWAELFKKAGAKYVVLPRNITMDIHYGLTNKPKMGDILSGMLEILVLNEIW